MLTFRLFLRLRLDVRWTSGTPQETRYLLLQHRTATKTCARLTPFESVKVAVNVFLLALGTSSPGVRYQCCKSQGPSFAALLLPIRICWSCCVSPLNTDYWYANHWKHDAGTSSLREQTTPSKIYLEKHRKKVLNSIKLNINLNKMCRP